MSAIAKPLIHTTHASLVEGRQAQPVGVESIIAVSKTGFNNPLPKKDDYSIVFALKSGGGGRPETVVWSYVSEADRDAQYAAVIAAISTEIV